jgi:hypothetical protein
MKTFLQKNLTGFFCVLSILLVTIIYSACKSSDGPVVTSQDKVSPDWITLEVRFKQKTDGEMRDMAIRGIEKLLLDSISAINPTFKPHFKISKNLFDDSLKYIFSVGKPMPLPLPPPPDGSTKEYSTAAKDTISNPPCLCKNGCGVCLMIKGVSSDTSYNPAFRAIESIEVLGQ